MTDPVAVVLRRGFGIMARGSLRGIWAHGRPPAGGFVWAADHQSWWDPFLASVVLERSGHQAALLMQQENLDQYEFVRRVGVFGSEEARQGLDYLGEGRALVIFPEGELRPAGPLGPLHGGASWYAVHAGVPLVGVAVRVLMRGHQAPEAYLSFEPVETTGTVPEVTERLQTRLAAALADLDALLRRTEPRTVPPGFVPLLRGRLSMDERIDRFASRIPGRRR